MRNGGTVSRVFDIVAGAAAGLLVGVVLNEPANRLWHQVNDHTFRLEDRDIEITASSTLASQTGCRYAVCNYSPDNLTDSRRKSAWSSEGPGVGSQLRILLLGDEVEIARLEIWPGWQDGNDCRLRRNARPREVQLSDDEGNPIGGVVTLDDPIDGPEFEASTLPVDWSGRALVLTILNVYPGQPCDGREGAVEVLISELEVHVHY